MPGAGVLRYDTELKSRPDYWKYRVAPPPESKYRSLFYKNDWDCFSKIVTGLSVGTLYGVVPVTAVSAYYAKPNLPLQARFYPKAIAEAFCKSGYQPIAAGVTYGVAVSLATHLRNEEDPWNHFIGGALAGSIASNLYKWSWQGTWSWRMTLVHSLFAGAGCAIGKFIRETSGHHFFWIRDAPGYNSFFTFERRNWEGANDANKDTRFRDGTANMAENGGPTTGYY